MDLTAKIKQFYDKNIYNEKHLAEFVRKNVITEEQYESITGKKYK